MLATELNSREIGFRSVPLVRTVVRVLSLSAISIALSSVLTACGGDAQTTHADEPTPCDDALCCASLEFAPEASRLYFEGGQLWMIVGARATDGSTEGVVFDAEVTSAALGTQLCTGKNERTSTGLATVICPTTQTDAVCDEAMVVQVRLRRRSGTSSIDESQCDSAAFGASATWSATVSCPVCGAVVHRQQCDYPPTESCGYAVSNKYCGSEPLACDCRLDMDGTRRWSCPIC